MVGKVPDGTDVKSLVTMLAYVDDVVLCCKQQHLSIIWPLWIKVLKDNGLRVEPKKCKAWRPQDTSSNEEVNNLISVVASGLPVLVTAAQAMHSTLITSPVLPIPLAGLLADASLRSKHAEMSGVNCQVVKQCQAEQGCMLLKQIGLKMRCQTREEQVGDHPVGPFRKS